jgi:hypothetical protein
MRFVCGGKRLSAAEKFHLRQTHFIRPGKASSEAEKLRLRRRSLVRGGEVLFVPEKFRLPRFRLRAAMTLLVKAMNRADAVSAGSESRRS